MEGLKGDIQGYGNASARGVGAGGLSSSTYYDDFTAVPKPPSQGETTLGISEGILNQNTIPSSISMSNVDLSESTNPLNLTDAQIAELQSQVTESLSNPPGGNVLSGPGY